MKKLILVLASFVLYFQATQAQQDARYTQYMFNKLVFNPAYAGSGDGTHGLSITALLRTQWVKIDGAPRSISLSAHTPLGAEKKVGIGGYLEHDRLGVHGRTSLFGSYSYSFLVGESKLALGIDGGILHIRSDYTSLTDNEAIDLEVDPAFLSTVQTQLLPNFGLGLYYYNPNKFYLGLSVPHLIDNKVGPTKIGHQERHYHLMGGILIGEGDFRVKPSFLVKLIPNTAPTQIDANLLFLIKQSFWVGGSFRLAPVQKNGANKIQPESLDAIVAFQLKNGLKIGYAYDLTLTELRDFTTGSHEVMLGFDLKGGKSQRYVTPRHF